MSAKSNFKINKIDAIIVVALIVIAGVVLTKAGYIYPTQEKIPTSQPDEPLPPPPPPTPPVSLSSEYMGFMRAISPEDEGAHFDQINICREWWYFGAALDNEDSELKDWTVSVSFNHMARGDLFGTLKPDMLIVTLNGPDGEKYGGIINKERGLGLIRQPTLQAKTPGLSIEFEDSWAEGGAPEWHVHAEDNDIDKNHEIVVDLNYFSPSDPLWTIGERAFQKSESNIASYMFTGCDVIGTIKIDGTEYHVEGKGHHEHSWSPNIITRGSINGWDWCHMTLNNGWNIYFSNYYLTPQYISTKTTKINPFGSLVITTDQGETLTILDDIDFEITKSDEKIFPFVKMPSEFSMTAKPSILQPLLKTYNVELELNIISENTCEKVWKIPTYVGMKVGMSTINGKITWSDDEGDQEVELNGIGNIWSMRALI